MNTVRMDCCRNLCFRRFLIRCVALLCLQVLSLSGLGEPAPSIVSQLKQCKGIAAFVGADIREEAWAAAEDGWTVYLQTPRMEEVPALRRMAADKGWLNTRVFIEGGVGELYLADNVADRLVIRGEVTPEMRKEGMRGLRPGGVGRLGEALFTKEIPEGADDWTHHYHGPDNNPQSLDTLARAPYLTHYVAEPRYAPAPQAVVSAQGRNFMAFGNVAWHEREEPWLNTLVCQNAWNGTILWTRPLESGIMVDRCTMIASGDRLYLADHRSCQVINAVNGETVDEIILEAPDSGGRFWKWAALEGETLYALIGEEEPRDSTEQWRRRQHGWPWNGISEGYNNPEYPWGMANDLFAIDLKTKTIQWVHREKQAMDSRGLCLKNGRLYLCRYGDYLTCLDARSGKEVWRRTQATDAELFEKIGAYRSGHGYVEGWKSTVFLKASETALYFVGPQTPWLTAVSAADGRFMWSYKAKDLHIVIRPDGVYAIGPQHSAGLSKKLDPLTGTVLAEFDISRRACTRSTGVVDGVWFRADGGSVRLDSATGRAQWLSPMRPSCHVGVVVANGHLYWVPWTCDCNLQMFGAIALAPAGEFDFHRPAVVSERRVLGERAQPSQPSLGQAAGDWATYRHDVSRLARTSTQAPTGAVARVEVLWTRHMKGKSVTAPVSAGDFIYVADDAGVVTALGAGDGETRWTYHTGGAIYYPPAIMEGRAFVASADGWIYALDAATGDLLWRFRLAPKERRIPFYGRLTSNWPAAAGVVAREGVVYGAAGLNNFDGAYVYALNARTGAIIWENNTSGHLDDFSSRGVGVQGDLLYYDGRLYLAGGNAASPGVYDAETGQCLTPAPQGTGSFSVRGRELTIIEQRTDRRGQPVGPGIQISGPPFYSNAANPVYDDSVQWAEPVIRAGDIRLACPKVKGREVWRMVAQKDGQDGELWSMDLPAEPVRWGLAVDGQGRIIVSLTDGRIMACVG